MGGADPVGTKTYNPRPTKRRTESVELTLVQITELEPVMQYKLNAKGRASLPLSELID